MKTCLKPNASNTQVKPISEHEMQEISQSFYARDCKMWLPMMAGS